MLRAGSNDEAVGWINEHLAKHGGTTSGLYLLTISRESARRQASILCWRQTLILTPTLTLTLIQTLTSTLHLKSDLWI